MLHDCPTSDAHGQQVVFVPRERYAEVLSKLVADGYAMCVDLTAVDYLTHPGRSLPEGVSPERFEVVVNLLSIEQRRRLRVRVQVPESDPSVASAFALYPGTEAMSVRCSTCSASPSPTIPTSPAS